MHSQKALDQLYPGLARALPLYYGQAERVRKNDSQINWMYLDTLDLEKENVIEYIIFNTNIFNTNIFNTNIFNTNIFNTNIFNTNNF